MMTSLLRRGAGALCALLSLGLAMITAGNAAAETPWERLALPEGAVIEIPADFRILSEKEVAGIASYAAGAAQRRQTRDPQRRLLVANAGEPSWAVVRLSVFDSNRWNREDLLNATESELRDVRDYYLDYLPKALVRGQARLREVYMPRIVTIAGHPALEITYRRSSQFVVSDWLVRMYSIETGAKKFLLTISNDLSSADRMDPILNRILWTIEFN
ncbi:hypothetical protein [Sutterella sp.]|uniref:hypothetical protein n=1 Tax=Sutterella sp. TaxID=1981025 RepID=UPI0026E0DA43|nr:hypothetical protein [Sutterella sp.]MDO5532000.1 hypothetical protein [Sutterella sp.]